MKSPAFLTLALFVAGSTLAPALDFIRQSQVINGNTVVTDQPVTSTDGTTTTGSVTSAVLNADLSIFQLWATYTHADGTTEMLKLDEKSIGTYLPSVSITASSVDPYIPTRTRADQPYNLTVTVHGMLSDPSYPDYTRRILFGRGYKEYSPVTFAPDGVAGTYANSNVFYANGTFNTTGIFQQLPGQTATGAAGAETFTASVQPGGNPSLGQLAYAEIVVWPCASASITGIVDHAKYLGFPQSGTITLTNAYPKSTNYAQIYPGGESLGTTGIVIPNTTTVYNTTQPQTTTISTISLEPISDQLTVDGYYTIEVLTVTPFNNGAPERLAYVTFLLQRTITLNGMITTSE